MRNTEKISSKILKAVEKVVRKELERNVFGKVPACAAIYHQPKRPKVKKHTCT